MDNQKNDIKLSTLIWIIEAEEREIMNNKSRDTIINDAKSRGLINFSVSENL
jgi:hypothetical protein